MLSFLPPWINIWFPNNSATWFLRISGPSLPIIGEVNVFSVSEYISNPHKYDKFKYLVFPPKKINLFWNTIPEWPYLLEKFSGVLIFSHSSFSKFNDHMAKFFILVLIPPEIIISLFLKKSENCSRPSGKFLFGYL